MDRVYQRNFISSLVGDGRPLLILVGISLVLCGGFALFLSASGQFLPHDIQFLGMTAESLCRLNQCRVVHFMFHDRVAFGGSLIFMGVIYIWLAEFPLRNGEAWAWWLFLVTGISGFGSFLAYLGFGYLDKWHAVATLLLLPCYVGGLQLSRSLLTGTTRFSPLWIPAIKVSWISRYGIGRAFLLAIAAGMICGGLTIMTVGMTRVFVPQDLQFLDITREKLNLLNPRLIPLIAHDRAGFGGGVCSCGILVFFVAWCGRPCRSLHQVLLFSGISGFATAIGIHPVIGYNNLLHLAPALLGFIVFIAAIVLLKQHMYSADNHP